jgi:hypothetical protein
MTQIDPRVSQMNLVEQQDPHWKAKSYVIGGLVGAAIGLGTAFLMARSSEKNRGGPPELEVGEMLRLGVAVIGVVRGIAALGD